MTDEGNAGKRSLADCGGLRCEDFSRQCLVSLGAGLRRLSARTFRLLLSPTWTSTAINHDNFADGCAAPMP